MENLKKVELIAQRLEAGAGGWVSSMQNLDCLLAAVQAIEMQEAEAALRKMAAGLTLPEGEASNTLCRNGYIASLATATRWTEKADA